jgi:glycine betaine/proline transport system substrate-binding protein
MNGKIHVQLEVWEGTMKKYFDLAVKSGKAIDGGSHPAKTREDWWYPAYVEKVCPGLPKWEALRDCFSKFRRKGEGTKGVYFDGPWEKPNRARIRALEMNFKVIKKKKGDGLWDELAKSFKKKEPIVLFNWTPNWVEAKYDGKFIEFPAWEKKCETEASWGISKKWKYDCGNRKDGWLKKLVSSNLPKLNKCAFEIVKNFSLTNKMIAKAAYFVKVDKMSVEDAAKAWSKKYQEQLNAWVPSSCQK